MIRTAAALSLLATLVACGGGGGDSASSDPRYTTISGCTARAVNVKLLGDSTQAGYDSGNNLTIAVHNPGTELQTVMDRVFGAGAVVVTDLGVGGTIAAQAPQVSGDVIVANYGINEAKTGVSVADYVTAMRALGATLIETPNPVWGQSWDDSPYAAAGESLGLPVADVQTYVLLEQPEWKSREHDGIHPDDGLYKDIVDNVLAPAVEAQVAPLRCLKG